MLKTISKQLLKQFSVNSKLLFEVNCAICNIISPNPLCNSCLNNIKKPEISCMQCGYEMNVVTKQQICKKCITNPPSYSFTNYIGIYENELRELIIRAKIKKDISAIGALRYLVATHIDAFETSYNGIGYDSFAAMPTPKSRLITRGYNLPYLLLKDIIKHKNTMHNNDFHISKSISTSFFKAKQAKMTLLQRQKNHHFFKIRRKITTNMIIFDDIITTENTVNSLTKSILEKSVTNIGVWAIARGKLN